MNKLTSLLCSLAIAASFIAGSANAQTVLDDSFSYPDGPLVGAPGSPWVHSSGTVTGEQNVVSGRLFLDDNETEDTSAPLSSDITAGFITASLSLEMSTADISTSGVGNYIMHFVGATTAEQIARLYTLTNPGGPAGTFRLGISTAGAAPVVFASPFTAGTVYSISITYDFDSNVASLSSPGFGTVVATDTFDAALIGDFAFRQSTAHGDVFIDSLSITAVPEPSTYAMMGLGAALLVGFQRFRRKS